MNVPELFKRDYMQSIIMIVAVVLVVLVFWYGLSLVFKTESPLLAVASESMEPVLYKGDLILIEGVDDVSTIHTATKDAEVPGDIIVYRRSDGELIVHRAVDVQSNGDGTYSFQTWGDNNQYPDTALVDENNVVGKYLDFKIPWFGHIPLAFADFNNKVILIVLCAAILILVEFFPLIQKRLKHSEQVEPTEPEESLY